MKRLCWMFLFFMMSCELIVDIEVPYDGDKIVLNSVQGPGGLWNVELTRAKYILDSGPRLDFPPVLNADVTLFEPDGSSFKFNQSALGYYWVQRTAEEGRTYRVVAKASGMKDIEASMTIPGTVKIIEAKWDSTNVRPPGNFPVYHQNVPLTVRLSDPREEKNYYSVIVYTHMVQTFTDAQTGEVHIDSLRNVSRTWVTDSSIAREEDHKSRFADFAFSGSTYSVPLITQFNLSPNQKAYKFEVVLFSLSEEYFKYEESRELFSESNGDPFSQPVQIYSNVTNGLGIFAGYSSHSVFFNPKN